MAVELDAVGVSRSIIIGAGGTGHRVLLETRKRLVDKYGSLDRIPIVQFLQLDTVPLQEDVRYPKEVNLTPNEYVFMEVQNIWKYRRNLSRHPHLEPWVPETILTSNVEQGAGQVRARGRFAFTENYPSIRGRLFGAMNRVTSDAAYREATNSGVRVGSGVISVYIVSSLLGGTGSGIFLDLAYAARNELRQAAGANSIDTIGMLILPPAGGELVEIFSANAFAALLELNYFNDNATEFFAQYQPGMPELRDPDDPFSFCYLMDSRNEQGEAIGENKLIEMLGHYLFLDLTHEFARHKKQNRDNHKAWLGRDEYDCPTKYLSFGLSALAFPKDQILHVCANRLAKELVSGWMDPAQPMDERDIEAEAAHRIAAANYDRDHVLSGLALEGHQQHGKGAADAIGEIARKTEEMARRSLNEGAIRALETMIQQDLPAWTSAGDEADPDVMRRRNLGTFPEEIRRGLVRRLEHAKQWLIDLVPELVNDPRYRHEGCRRVLAVIERLASTYRDDLLRESAAHKAQCDALVKDLAAKLNQARGEIRKVMVPGAGASAGRKAEKLRAEAREKAEAAVAALCRVAATLAQTRVQAFVCDCALRFYRDLLTHLSALNREVGRYEERVGELRERFRAEEVRFLESVPAVNGEVLYSGREEDAAEAIEHYFEQVGPEALQELDGRVQAELGIARMGLYGYFMAEAATSLDAVASTLLRHTASAFRERLEAVEVLDLFFARYPDERTAESQIERLNRLSAPFVNAKAGGVGGFRDRPEQRQRNVGIPNADEPRTPAERRFKAMATKAASIIDERSWVPVASRSEALFLQERAGFPLRLMEDALQRCQSHYEHIQRVRKEPIHSRLDIPHWGSLNPPPPDLKAEAWELFLLAVAAGAVAGTSREVITQRGTERRWTYEVEYADDQGVRHRAELIRDLPALETLAFDGRDYPNGVTQLLLRLCDRDGLTELARRVRQSLDNLVKQEGAGVVRERLLVFVNQRIPERGEFSDHARAVISRYLKELGTAEPADGQPSQASPSPGEVRGPAPAPEPFQRLDALLASGLIDGGDYAGKLKEMVAAGTAAPEECLARLAGLRDQGHLSAADYELYRAALAGSAAVPAAEDPMVARLKRLKAMHDEGLITDAEFQAKKREILLSL